MRLDEGEVKAIYYAYYIRGPRRRARPFVATNDPPKLPPHYKQYQRVGMVSQIGSGIKPFAERNDE